MNNELNATDEVASRFNKYCVVRESCQMEKSEIVRGVPRGSFILSV